MPVDDAGEVTGLRLADIAPNRGMMAVKKEFADPDEFQHIGFRILTFSEVIHLPKLTKMGMVQRDENGNLEVHDAVVHALAKAPFRKSGTLDKPAFLALVKTERERIESESDS